MRKEGIGQSKYPVYYREGVVLILLLLVPAATRRGKLLDRRGIIYNWCGPWEDERGAAIVIWSGSEGSALRNPRSAYPHSIKVSLLSDLLLLLLNPFFLN